MSTNTPEKRLAEAAERDAEKLYTVASNLTITNDDQLRGAAELLAQVKVESKKLKATKTDILNPLKTSIERIKTLFKPSEEKFAAAEGMLKDAMLTYHEIKDAAAKKEAERIERRVDKGTMRIDTGMAKLAVIDQAETNVQTESGGVQFRHGRAKVRVTDPMALITAVPELLESERVLEALRMEVSQRVIADEILLPGVEIYRDKLVAGVTR